MITDKSVKVVCFFLLILAVWGIFLYCLMSGQSTDVIKGVGVGSALLTFFGMIAISEE